ncbi:hypothetical protein [Pedobacter gandavensis]|uniref:hypothetical protein n=1 Tax=Pedobacter gandavensis TaxID=2679963 RepID=UPI002930C9EE|nr:hypothetical protein [Pedobacter gandavensis]
MKYRSVLALLLGCINANVCRDNIASSARTTDSTTSTINFSDQKLTDRNIGGRNIYSKQARE